MLQSELNRAVSMVAISYGMVACGSASNGPVGNPCPNPTPVASAPHSTSAAPLTGTGGAASTISTAEVSPPRERSAYAMAATEVRAIHSEVTGKDHELIFGLPPSFAKEPTRRYPVLYLLDGQWDFALLAALSGGLRYDQVMPEMLIVGLSYGGTDPNYDQLRADDYVPTRAKDFQGKELGGGGGKFLEFLQKTVIPMAEKEYRADPAKRVLSGSSYGGLFTLYALFEKPELFQAYVAISPAVGWDDHYLSKRERNFHKAHPNLDRRVWLSIGDSEWPNFVADAKAFFGQFESSRYRGLTLAQYTVVGERHAGVKPEAYNRAMRFVSEPWLPKSPK
jgi:predicted alpha/beta superfamily hydrolase